MRGANSQLTSMYRPFAVKSAWLTPAHIGTESSWRSRIVCASRKSIRRRCSAITTAYRPSGVKYRLYGSSTGIVRPGFPVTGSIAVRLLPMSLLTHSVFRSYEGTMCWGTAPTLKCRTIRYVRWSIS